jgi:hypothetical protein
MATIKINHLKSNGVDLFNDSENFMHELANEDFAISKIHGGTTPLCVATAISLISLLFPKEAGSNC